MKIGLLFLATVFFLLLESASWSNTVVDTEKKTQLKFIQDNPEIYPFIEKSLSAMLEGKRTGLVVRKELYPTIYLVRGYDVQEIAKTAKTDRSVFYRVEFAFDVVEKISQETGKIRRISLEKRLEATAFLQKEGSSLFWSGRLQSPYVDPGKEKSLLTTED